MAINAEWHQTHRMPKNPTPQERLQWHEAHAKECGCRPFTSDMRDKLVRAVEVKAQRAARRRR